MDSSGLLMDLPPALMEDLCRVLDSGQDRLGWRGLAVRVVSSLLEVQMLERVEAAGRSPSRELLWSWSLQNSRVQDLVQVLQDMGHLRALQVYSFKVCLCVSGLSSSCEQSVHPPAAGLKEPIQSEANSQPVCSLNSGEKQNFSLTLRDVIEGTRTFHPDMRITEGNFCDVFRAQTRSKTFTVKLFKQIKNVSWETLCDDFRREEQIHHLYKHPNIMDLLFSFCEDRLCCLVFAHLSNGSLFDRLHHLGTDPPLSWKQRLIIIKGTAKALYHLHTAMVCPLICGNICSANILLDEDLQPKLSDFTSARYPQSASQQRHTITMDTSSISNHGYLPEDFIRDRKLSCSLDVYSFGMVVMEAVTGLKVREKRPKRTLRDMLLSEVEVGGGLDSCLQFLDVSAGLWPSDVTLSLLDVSLQCSAGRPRSRPSMERVLLTLSKLLPPPSCPPTDLPHSLQDGGEQSPSSSVPVEHDEHSPPCSPAHAEPCECSQSEVTYLSVEAHGGGVKPDISWPVQCSCSEGLTCEDCRANGFTPNPLTKGTHERREDSQL
uniref:interleukin-1 receptor-associated kinase 3 n=1 Tax=Semicossyphus pulcher TaxID=241346 RepID=UPI0037E92944